MTVKEFKEKLKRMAKKDGSVKGTVIFDETRVCKNCYSHLVCAIYNPNFNNFAPSCNLYMGKEDYEKVVMCKDCKHGRPLDRTKSPFKYYKDGCVLCECEDVVGDEPMVYLPTHFCSYGET